MKLYSRVREVRSQADGSLQQKYDLQWQSQVGGTELCQSIKLAP